MYQEFAYRYFRKHQNSGNIVWRCVAKSCSATVTTDAAVSVPIKQNKIVHGHGAAKLDVHLKETRWAAKQEARANVTEKSLQYLKDHQAQVTCTMNAMEQMMNRERRKGPPPVAAEGSVAEVTRLLRQTDVVLDDGQRFVHVTESAEPMVVVTCATNLTFLRNHADAVFADVTTTSRAAARFPRAYTVHGIAGSRCVPLAYFFVPAGHSEDVGSDHTRMWTAMDGLCRELAGGPFAPALLLLADLTPAVHAAAAWACPGAVVKAARFHVSRAWGARVYASPVLRATFRDTAATTGPWLRSFFGLPYLPPELVPDAFVELMADCPRHQPFVNFADYVLENYIENDGALTPDQWAQRPGGCNANTVISYFGRAKQRFRVPLSDIFYSVSCVLRLLLLLLLTKVNHG